MAFQLVIAEGKEAGREFVFEQESVLIGRTSDCDVVLYDPGVSRKHARIFSGGTGYFVEDMGSSNGTKVNGEIITKHQLADGDAIGLGPVVFNYSGVSLGEENTDSNEVPAGAGQSTRILSASEVRRSKGKGAALAPSGAGDRELQALSRSRTRSIEAVNEPRRSQPGSRERAIRAPIERVEPSPLSAAERARIRRNSSSASAALQIFWAEASATQRLALRAVLSLLGVALVGAATYFAFVYDPNPAQPPPPEPTDLVPGQPFEASFGLGEGVTYERADQKVFDFEYKSPVKMVVVLHYQARDISANEVIISVNGTDVDYVPADTLAVNERSNEQVVPASALKRNAGNKVVFDNTKNPPNQDPWRVWNVWLEAVPLLELPRDELVKHSQDSMGKGQDFWDRRTVGAENTYKAWTSYREAWLTLESLEGQKPVEYTVARAKMREAQVALDRLCTQLLLEAKTAFSQKQFEAARLTLEHVTEYFPKKDQPCPFRAEQLREENGL